ncbi:hypothetical protein ISF_00955 [Cordyceps fumosorosea ARSEF 2679]|uniref:Elongator complex protein 6 n=1 Tax=Cordyceps fumosorosea (strain ARSEF 2679) TaxID=1081104 RepID=A0A162LQ86_CORFA|nr:hypothetical protein ISF_00955 [Cordyceps fumosorosea ARSEF 2679]OAA74054.1 hypothetical protein ISF_00955 [Cordyceps fumosorosea ARSEF 2679]
MPSPTQPSQLPRRPAASEIPSSSSSSSRIPALLMPYVASGPLTHDEGSLTVITWVQGASANWLVLRYLYALLGGGGGGRSVKEEDEAAEEGQQPGVVLVSFLRDQRFWGDGCAKLGMDLEVLGRSGRFGFVDGLTGSLGGEGGPATTTDGVKKRVDEAAARLSPRRRRVLVVDALDALVATTGISASEAESLMMRLRENAYSTLLTLSADEPLMRAAVRRHQQHQQEHGAATGLEREQAALVLGQAHAANQVVSLRRLDTGAAADVSGVLRVGAAQELLYHVSGDGGVRVFERGA